MGNTEKKNDDIAGNDENSMPVHEDEKALIDELEKIVEELEQKKIQTKNDLD